MKSFLRFLLVLLGVIVIGIIVLGVVEPKDVTIQRSIVINAPKTAVFEQVVKFKNWPHWSPWYQMDTNVQMTYNGTDGSQGSNYHWVGDPKRTGEGEMSNTGVEGTKLNYALHFIKPYDGQAQGYFDATDTGNSQTKVVWSISMHQKFPMNAMNAFMNMDKMLGGDFDRGLQNLKKYVETNAGPATDAAITEIDQSAMTFAGVRKQMGWSDMTKFFMDTYPMLGKTLHPDANTHAYGLYYNWDTLHHTTDVAAVFPIKDTTAHIAGITYFHVPAGRAYVAVHNGGYSSEGREHNALMQYIAAKNQHPGLVMEEYIIGHYAEPDSNKWVTRIIYIVQ